MIFNENIVNLLKKGTKDAFESDEIPVCAVIFDKDQNVISCCSNCRQSTGNILGHAEILAIVEAGKVLGDWRLNGYSMLVNLEPCTMCSSVIKESRLDKVYFLLEKPDLDHVISINSEYVDGYEAEKSYFKELLTVFFDNRR